MSSNDHTEKFFNEQFSSFKQTPPASVWKHIERKMVFKRFLKYKPFSLNLWNIIIVAAIASSIIFIKPNTTHQISDKPAVDNYIKNKTAKNDVNKLTILTENNKNIIKEKEDNYKPKSENNKNYKTKSGNQNPGNEKRDVIPFNLLKKNYTHSESNNEEKTNVKSAEPRSEFTVSTSSACEPAAITFYNASENCDSFHWDFGNGNTSSQKNPNFVFRTAGTYTVTLTVTSGRFSDLSSKKITIFPRPNVDFEIRNKSKRLFNNDEILFSNNSSAYSKCIWNFGDQNTSGYTSPSHIYENAGNYKVSLICISDNKCADTAYINNVLIQNSIYKISFPTAFSPDKSGQSNGYWNNSTYPNTIFHPIVKTEISNYKLKIYNKYGVLIFESNQLELGWNGFYRNIPAPSEVYVWECSGKYENGKQFKETGNLTLLYLRNQ